MTVVGRKPEGRVSTFSTTTKFASNHIYFFLNRPLTTCNEQSAAVGYHSPNILAPNQQWDCVCLHTRTIRVVSIEHHMCDGRPEDSGFHSRINKMELR